MKPVVTKLRFPLLLALWTMVFAAAGTSSSLAREVPPLNGRVNDTAHLLSPHTREYLEQELTQLEAEDSTQIAILTIDSLAGEDLESYSLKVAETWQLGQKQRDNGALLLIAVEERKIRIEVGYGLEGSLTDLVTGRIIRQVITPRFRSGDFDRGVTEGVEKMIEAVKGEFTAETPLHSGSSGKGGGNDLGGILAFLIWGVFFLGRIFGRNRLLSGFIGSAAAFLVTYFILEATFWMAILSLPAGFLLGFLSGMMFGSLGRSGRGVHSTGYGHGSFSSGGFGGGFSGGGGGFGGGGSSGGW